MGPRNEAILVSAGVSTKIYLGRLFSYLGPYCLYTDRGEFDFPISLGVIEGDTDIEIISDQSTKTSSTNGKSESRANAGSLLIRGAVGLAAGGTAGAIVGAVTGKRTATISSVTDEKINLDLLIKVTFSNGKVLAIRTKNPSFLEFLLSCLSEEPVREDLLSLKNKAIVIHKDLTSKKARKNKARSIAESEIKENFFSKEADISHVRNYILPSVIPAASYVLITASEISIWSIFYIVMLSFLLGGFYYCIFCFLHSLFSNRKEKKLWPWQKILRSHWM